MSFGTKFLIAPLKLRPKVVTTLFSIVVSREARVFLGLSLSLLYKASQLFYIQFLD